MREVNIDSNYVVRNGLAVSGRIYTVAYTQTNSRSKYLLECKRFSVQEKTVQKNASESLSWGMLTHF